MKWNADELESVDMSTQNQELLIELIAEIQGDASNFAELGDALLHKADHGNAQDEHAVDNDVRDEDVQDEDVEDVRDEDVQDEDVQADDLTQDDEDAVDEDDEEKAVDPVIFHYLSAELQFSKKDAKRAIRAVVGADGNGAKVEDRESTLLKCLDWLCLSLEATTLDAAFKGRPRKSKDRNSSNSSNNRGALVISSNRFNLSLQTQTDWKMESRIFSICQHGFTRAETLDAMEACGEDASDAEILLALARQLHSSNIVKLAQEHAGESLADCSDEELAEMVTDELIALESIYGEDRVTTEGMYTKIRVDFAWPEELLRASQKVTSHSLMSTSPDIVLHVLGAASCRYPETVPPLILTVQGIPPKICRMLTEKVLLHLCTLAGGPMLHELLDWIDNDGRSILIRLVDAEVDRLRPKENPNKGETRTGKRAVKRMMTSGIRNASATAAKTKDTDDDFLKRVSSMNKSRRRKLIKRQ